MIASYSSIRSLMDHVPFFGFRLFSPQGGKKAKLVKTYTELLNADDHILRDIGVTRLDVIRLRENLFR